jgi:hypothetical protein
MRSTKASIVIFAFLGIGLSANCAQPPAGSYQDLVTLNEEFLEFREVSTVDGVPDYSAEAMKTREENIPEFRRRLKSIDPEGWTIPQKVDYLVVNSKINQLEFDHRVTRLWARDPSMYLNLVRRLPYAEVPIPQDEQAEFRMRLQAVPKILEQAKKNLTAPVPDLAKVAIFLLESYDGVAQGEPLREIPPAGTVGWYGDLVERLTEPHSSLVPDALAALAAVEAYRDWLADNLDGMTEAGGVGLDNFNWYLKNVLYAPYDTDQLLLLGERELARWRTYLKIEENKNDHRGIPPLELATSKEEYDERVREAERQIRALMEQQELLTLPPDTRPEFETDAYWRGGKTRHFWEELQYRNAFDNHIHASIPGHRFDGFMGRKVTNPIRRNHYDGLRSEGWATYIEEMFMNAGLMDEVPRARELIYIALLKRGARVMAELKIHNGEFTLDQANQYIMDHVPYMEPNIGRYDLQVYVRRPSTGSQYVLGKIMMEKLISDRAGQLGEEFDLGAFHDEFHTKGIIPMSLIRWEMTGQDDEIRDIWEELTR